MRKQKEVLAIYFERKKKKEHYANADIILQCEKNFIFFIHYKKGFDIKKYKNNLSITDVL